MHNKARLLQSSWTKRSQQQHWHSAKNTHII